MCKINSKYNTKQWSFTSLLNVNAILNYLFLLRTVILEVGDLLTPIQFNVVGVLFNTTYITRTEGETNITVIRNNSISTTMFVCV